MFKSYKTFLFLVFYSLKNKFKKIYCAAKGVKDAFFTKKKLTDMGITILRHDTGNELKLTFWVGIWIPIFSIAFANSSGSTVPLSLRSKYLNAFMSTCCSDWAPFVFSPNLFFNSLSKLKEGIKISFQSAEAGKEVAWKNGKPLGWVSINPQALHLPFLKVIHMCLVFDFNC